MTDWQEILDFHHSPFLDRFDAGEYHQPTPTQGTTMSTLERNTPTNDRDNLVGLSWVELTARHNLAVGDLRILVNAMREAASPHYVQSWNESVDRRNTIARGLGLGLIFTPIADERSTNQDVSFTVSLSNWGRRGSVEWSHEIDRFLRGGFGARGFAVSNVNIAPVAVDQIPLDPIMTITDVSAWSAPEMIASVMRVTAMIEATVRDLEDQARTRDWCTEYERMARHYNSRTHYSWFGPLTQTYDIRLQVSIDRVIGYENAVDIVHSLVSADERITNLNVS